MNWVPSPTYITKNRQSLHTSVWHWFLMDQTECEVNKSVTPLASHGYTQCLHTRTHTKTEGYTYKVHEHLEFMGQSFLRCPNVPLVSLCASVTKRAGRPLLGDIRGEISVKTDSVLPEAATERQACPLACPPVSQCCC